MIARLLVALIVLWSASPAAAQQFEVWLIDQSNSPGVSHGGAIYIYQGEDLMGEDATRAPAAKIDLGGATTQLCMASTGANPVRPHMIFFNSTGSHAVLAFVASGHVVFFDSATRAPVACLRSSPGAGGARQAHAAVPTRDDAAVLVANQNGKLLERIATNYATNSFVLDTAAHVESRHAAPRRTASPASSRECVPTTRRSARLWPRITARRLSPSAAAATSSLTTRPPRWPSSVNTPWMRSSRTAVERSRRSSTSS